MIYHSIDRFFSFKTMYETCNAIYWQKARIKSETSMAQTISRATVYGKGLTMYKILSNSFPSRLISYVDKTIRNRHCKF
jgi:hypothetical protein